MNRYASNNDIREVITELLSQLGSSREAREYLKRFSSVDSVQFAIIKVGGQVIRDQLAELASALHFLYQAGLYPIVLHGAGPQLDEAIRNAGIESRKIDGLRVTTPEVMAIVRQTIYQENLRLVNALERLGARTRSIQHGVFECRVADNPDLGLVGSVERVHLSQIEAAIEANAMPVVTCLGESTSGQVLNVNADYAVNALIQEIEPYKIIFITPTGGMLNEHGQIMSSVNLVTDYDRLVSANWVHSGMRLKLEQIKSLLDKLPDSASVSITSAENLTKELFTHGGAGTLIRRGETIVEACQLTPDDERALYDLVESCFGRKLLPNWLQTLNEPRILWLQSRRGVAVITQGQDSIHYLDKFAVTPQAQGEGLASALWKEVKQAFPKLYWRSRSANPINPWYHRHADFSFRAEPWIIFGYGVDDFEQVNRCIIDAAQRPQFWTDAK